MREDQRADVPPARGGASLARGAAGRVDDMAMVAALEEVGRDLAGTLGIGQVADRVVGAALRVIGGRRALVYELAEATGTLTCRAVAGDGDPATWIGQTIPRGLGVIGRVVEEGRLVATADVLADPRIALPGRLGERIEADTYRAAAGVPLVAGCRVIGVLLLVDVAGRVLGDRELRVLGLLADYAAVAIRNGRLVEEAERRRRAAEELARVARVLTESLDAGEVAERIVSTVLPLFDLAAADLWLLQPDGARVVVARAGATGHLRLGEVLPPGVGIAGRAVLERRPVWSPDVLGQPELGLPDDLRLRIAASGIRAVLSVPLVARGMPIGVLSVGALAGRAFTDEEITLLAAFGDQAALALQNARSFEEARRVREFLESIAEHSPDAIVATDTDGHLTYVSRGVEEMLGYPAQELLGRPLTDLYRSGAEEARAIMRELEKRGRLRHYETTLRTKSGGWIDVSASFALLRDKGGVTLGSLGIVSDVSDRRRLEEQLRQAQKMDAIGRLAGGIAHDFNNLLTVITGRTELMLAQLPAEHPQRRHMDLVQKTAERAAALTRQLLTFSRKQPVELRVLDLNSVLTGMERMLRRLIGEHIDLVTVTPPRLGRVRADPGQLEQVVMNLAINARDAMPHGGRLTLETSDVDLDETYARQHVGVRPGPYVMLAVSDTGIGMDAETQARLFEPFFTTKPAGQGTGLGLATVYGIVAQSRGTVWVYSEVGRGTTFKVYLPRVDEAATPGDAPRPAAPAPRGSETVLLVEDDEALGEVAREILELSGYAVLGARHGNEALLVALQHPGPIHLLVTDVVLPQMSGRDLAERLAASRPDIRVLFMSGYADGAIVHQDVLAPGAAFVQKPFTPEGLARRVREVLDRGRRAP
jgi:PAS domain S-box-containing protein